MKDVNLKNRKKSNLSINEIDCDSQSDIEKIVKRYFPNGYPLCHPAFFAYSLVGKSGQGKTSFILNLIEKFKNAYHQIIVLSGSAANDGMTETFINRINKEHEKAMKKKMKKNKNKKNMFGLPEEDIIPPKIILYDNPQKKILDVCDYVLSGDDETKLIIIDDGSHMGCMFRNKQLHEMTTRRRQLKCSIITATHTPKNIDTTLRDNVDALIAFQTDDGLVEKLADAYNLEPKMFKELNRYLIKNANKWDPLVVDLRNRKWFCSLDVLLKDEMKDLQN